MGGYCQKIRSLSLLIQFLCSIIFRRLQISVAALLVCDETKTSTLYMVQQGQSNIRNE